MTNIRVFEVVGTVHRLILEKAAVISSVLIVYVIALALMSTATDLGWLSSTGAWAPKTIAGAFLAYFWHRTILLDLKDQNAAYSNEYIQGFITRYFVVFGLVFFPFLIGLFLFFSKTALGILLGVMCFFAAAYLPSRMICSLPAKAIGADETMGSIWRSSGKIVWKLMFASGMIILPVLVAVFVLSVVAVSLFESNDQGNFTNPVVTIFFNTIVAAINAYSGLWLVGIVSVIYQRTFMAEPGSETDPQPVEV